MRIETLDNWDSNWAVNLNGGGIRGLYPVYVGDSGSDCYYFSRTYISHGMMSNEIILEIKRK